MTSRGHPGLVNCLVDKPVRDLLGRSLGTTYSRTCFCVAGARDLYLHRKCLGMALYIGHERSLGTWQDGPSLSQCWIRCRPSWIWCWGTLKVIHRLVRTAGSRQRRSGSRIHGTYSLGRGHHTGRKVLWRHNSSRTYYRSGIVPGRFNEGQIQARWQREKFRLRSRI